MLYINITTQQKNLFLPNLSVFSLWLPSSEYDADDRPCLEFCRNDPAPKYEFIDYFFHGDFHLGNIVEVDERYMVIDWTNGQLGDSRYDFAWSLTLQNNIHFVWTCTGVSFRLSNGK